MDFSKLSDSDLQQIAKGDMRMVSVKGLQMLAGDEPQANQDDGFFANHSLSNIPQNLGNLGAGLLRGAGSIGATVLLPADMINQKLRGEDFFSLKDNIERRQGMDSGLQAAGANTDSGLYATGKLGGEIAGTAGVGNVLAGAKILANVPKFANAIRSGGFNLGSPAAKALSMQGLGNASTRLAGAGINAGASTLLATGSPEDALTGAGIGMAIPVVGKVAGATGKGISNVVKKAINPLVKSGRANILTDNLIAMLGDKAPDVARNLSLAKGNVADFIPSAGQAGKSAELAAFERAFKNKNAGLFQDFKSSQNTALANAARGLGGDDLTRIGLDDARYAAAQPYYDAGKLAQVESSKALESLFKRPIIGKAFNAADINARNAGEEFANNSILSGTLYQDNAPELIDKFSRQEMMKGGKVAGGVGDYDINKVYNGKDLQEIKFALDAAKKFNPMASTGERMTQGKVFQASNAFNQFLADNVPDIRKGDEIFQKMSKPINQLDIGNEIATRYIPSKYSDSISPLEFKANSAEMLSRIAKNTGGAGDALARKVTGFGGATFENSTSSKQRELLNNLVKDNLQIDAGSTLGRELGSPTYQHLAYNAKGEDAGLVSGLLGVTPTGRVLSKLRDFAYSKPLQKLDNDLALMLQNPKATGAQIEARLAKLDDSKRRMIMQLIGQTAAKTLPVGLLGN